MNMSARKRVGIFAAAAVLVIATAVLVWYITRPRYTLTATYVKEEPRLDGIPNETGWAKAKSVEIPVKNGPAVTLKALYTTDRVFFQARFKDQTKDDIDEPWTFDGKKWTKGRTSDQFALFFDIDDSIKDFSSKGFEVMDFGFKPHKKLWEFGITGPEQKSTAYWEGYKQRADVWMMHSSISSPFGKGDDGYFGVSPQYLLSPTLSTPRIWVQWDQFKTPGVLKLNTVLWREAIKASEGENAVAVAEDKPYLTYKDSKMNLNNTPYPFEDELVPIKDYGRFKKGDRLPWVYFRREQPGQWGGSRDDIDGKMRYENGYWTVEMGRKINTGHPDDVTFKPGDGKPVWFGALVRVDGQTIRYSVPAKFEFAPQGGGS